MACELVNSITLLCQVAHAPVGSMHSDSGGDPAERFEADMDRWEPGSDFESSKAAAPRAASRRAVPLANGAATHAPQPGRGRSAGGDVEGLPAPVASVDRLDLCSIACCVSDCTVSLCVTAAPVELLWRCLKTPCKHM